MQTVQTLVRLRSLARVSSCLRLLEGTYSQIQFQLSKVSYYRRVPYLIVFLYILRLYINIYLRSSKMKGNLLLCFCGLFQRGKTFPLVPQNVELIRGYYIFSVVLPGI